MALYDYKCRVCDDVVTVSHSVSESPSVACGVCSSPRFKKFSAPALQFPGGGWGKDAR